jgi:hypothetical protein
MVYFIDYNDLIQLANEKLTSFVRHKDQNSFLYII